MSERFMFALNRGTVSRLALARLDLPRLAVAAEIQTNWMPRALGSAMVRPGFGYVATEPGETHLIEFVFAQDDTALVQLHDEEVSFVVDDEILTRPTVTAAITNGTFASNITGWLSLGIAATWDASGAARLVGNGVNVADLAQAVTVNEVGTEHGLRVTVSRGSVVMAVRTAYLGTDIIPPIELEAGTHSIGFTPMSGAFTVVFTNKSVRPALIDSVVIESGDVLLPTPWTEDQLPEVREYQSGNVIFLACDGVQQRRIIRKGDRSWSVQLYAPEDGPFLVENTSPTTLTASALTGDITLTASGDAIQGVFTPEHVGALFSLSSVGQAVTAAFVAQNTFSSSIRVTGVGSSRTFSIVITGTFTATVTLQYSVDNSVWYDRTTYTGPVSTSLTDGLDNQIVYYRLGVKTGDYTSGTATSTLSYSSGSITGVVRVTGYTSPLAVSAEVLKDLGGTTATDTWAEGAWSDHRGWPSAVTIHDGRLIWAGKDRFWASVTDQFYTFDPDFVGDAGPISRSIGFGPVDNINWLLPMNRLMAGTAGSELTCRSSSFDEPLTPTNFTPKETSTQGSARIQALKVDGKAIFVQRCLTRIYEMAISADSGDYTPEDLTALNPDACAPGVVYMGVQRQPDTRLHFVLSDGTAAVLVYDRAEKLICWVKVETDGAIEDVAVLPGVEEDAVYYVVKRTTNGADARYLERWALEREAQGGTINKMADCFVQYSGPATTTITGLGMHEGEEVIVWGNGKDLSPGYDDDQVTYPVTGGQIIGLPEAVTTATVGRAYKADLKSAKLASWSQRTNEVTLAKKKKIDGLGLIMADVHAAGVRFGPDFDNLDPLPEQEQRGDVAADEVRADYEEPIHRFPGAWATDSRLCLRGQAPRPCTVLAAVIEMA